MRSTQAGYCVKVSWGSPDAGAFERNIQPPPTTMTLGAIVNLSIEQSVWMGKGDDEMLRQERDRVFVGDIVFRSRPSLLVAICLSLGRQESYSVPR